MKRTAFVVSLAAPTPDDPEAVVEHHVTVIHPDRLVAEQMGHRLGVPPMADSPLTATTLWCWAAMKRQGLVDVNAKVFLNDLCMDVAQDKAADPNVDPTGTGQGTDSP